MKYIEAICGPKKYIVPFSGDIATVMSGDYIGNGECFYEKRVCIPRTKDLYGGVLKAAIQPQIYADPDGNYEIEGILSDLIFETSEFSIIYLSAYDVDADFKDVWWVRVKFDNVRITKFKLIFDKEYVVELKKRYDNCIGRDDRRAVYEEGGVVYHVNKDYVEVYCGGLIKLIIPREFY